MPRSSARAAPTSSIAGVKSQTIALAEWSFFGGILRCDILAQGVIAAVRELGVRAPIVVRMEGTNVVEGKRLLRESGMNFTTADSMDEAAETVVRLAG